jgi:hypothetical protein
VSPAPETGRAASSEVVPGPANEAIIEQDEKKAYRFACINCDDSMVSWHSQSKSLQLWWEDRCLQRAGAAPTSTPCLLCSSTIHPAGVGAFQRNKGVPCFIQVSNGWPPLVRFVANGLTMFCSAYCRRCSVCKRQSTICCCHCEGSLNSCCLPDHWHCVMNQYPLFSQLAQNNKHTADAHGRIQSASSVRPCCNVLLTMMPSWLCLTKVQH